VRLTGTNADLGQKLIDDFAKQNSDVKMHVIADFDTAATTAVNLAK
jgi:succinyl-CoA synthetase beta subunit